VIGDAIGRAIVATIVVTALVTALGVLAVVFGVPWLWALVKPWLHAMSA